MNLGLVVVALLGLVACGSCKPLRHNITQLVCDSLEAEAAAQVALDFINAQQTHGYKYSLNQIEDAKVINKADETHVYLLELEFLETKCHVYNPKAVPQCAVRTKIETAVEADCDVVLSKAGGNFSVIAFKCKTELGCPYLLQLNHTEGNQLVRATLEHFNRNHTLNAAFALLDVGRLSSQIVSGGPLLRAEYAIIETNCTSVDDDSCVPLDHAVARHGFCLSEGQGLDLKVDCEIFPLNNGTLPAPPAAKPGSPSTTRSLKHHTLTALHNPDATDLLSAESESAENAPIVKRSVIDPLPFLQRDPEPIVLPCPGKIRHFDV